MKLLKKGSLILTYLKKICPPAMLYLVLSTIGFLGILLQNCNTSKEYIIGDIVVKTPCHNAWFFIGKVIYIAIWTWLLNLLCSKGYTIVSWFLVLLPFITMFVLIAIFMLSLLHR